jgi:hypothetical protein
MQGYKYWLARGHIIAEHVSYEEWKFVHYEGEFLVKKSKKQTKK